MSFAEIQEQALALELADRERLVASLLDSLPPDLDTSDEEVLQRSAEIRAGTAEEISHEEMVHRIESKWRK